MAVGGITIPGQRYQDPSTGLYGTAQEHAQRKRTQQTQQPYTEAQPSPRTAGGAAQQAANVSGGTGAGYNVDPYGYTSFNDTAQQDRTTLAAQAKLNAEAEARRLTALKSLMSQYGTGSGGVGDLPPRIEHGTGIQPNEEAARAAAFARAKDATGNLAAAQLRGLQGAMAGRGVAGSPIETLGQAGILGGARGGLDQVVANQLMQDLNRAAEVSDLEYTGGITQRGQDINKQRDTTNQQILMSLFSQLY